MKKPLIDKYKGETYFNLQLELGDYVDSPGNESIDWNVADVIHPTRFPEPNCYRNCDDTIEMILKEIKK